MNPPPDPNRPITRAGDQLSQQDIEDLYQRSSPQLAPLEYH